MIMIMIMTMTSLIGSEAGKKALADEIKVWARSQMAGYQSPKSVM